jgi:DNA-directed RNA polymerase specialized sigma24 family protein
MDHDSRDLPDTQVFWIEDAVLIACIPEPEPRKPDPPPRAYDEHAARELVEMGALVGRVLKSKGVPAADVPDVTQAVLLDLLDWWMARGPAGVRELRAYVAAVAGCAASRHHRSRYRRGELVPAGDAWLLALSERDGAAVPSEPSPEDAVLAAEARAALAAELSLDALAAATTPALWRAFYAHTVLGVPVEVIADSERVSAATIYNRIRLARDDLRAALRRKRAAKRG